MKKLVIPRFRADGLIGLISCTTVLGISFSMVTYAQNYTVAQSNRTLSSALIWPTQGNLTQRFNTYHEGIDIAGAVGTPIMAAASGTVIKAGWDDSGWGLGNLIVIQHEAGTRTIYAHNSRLLVSKGQQVIQGQAIALMGSTGNSTGAHLHFEVHPQGRVAVDPFPLLPPLVGGKIPSGQMATASQPVVSQSRVANNSGTLQMSNPVSRLPIASEKKPLPAVTVVRVPSASITVTAKDQCGDVLIAGETTSSRLKVCRARENGQLLYVRQPKQQAIASMPLLARPVGQHRYRADQGNYSYYISSDRVETWRDGRPLYSERVYGVQ